MTLNQVYDELFWQGRDKAEKIKYFIKKSHEEWGVYYVLLVGGIKNQFSMNEEWWFPVRYSFLEDRWSGLPHYKEHRFLSDLYFADLYFSDGSFCSWDSDQDGFFGEWKNNESAEDFLDLKPDVYVGRLPCINKREVKIMVDKIIDYETTSFGPWFNKMVVVAGDNYPGNSYYEGEFETQRALDKMPDFEHVKLWASTGNYTGTLDIMKNINQGCGFLYMAGHGSPTSWATHPPDDKKTWINGIKNFQMSFLYNFNRLPVCVVSACHSSMFNVTFLKTFKDKDNSMNMWTYGFPIFECWSWRLTSLKNRGSIATVGNTALGYGREDKLNPENGGAAGHLNMCFFEEYGENNTTILGEIWGKAINCYLKDYPIMWNENSYNDTSIDAKTVEQWILFGDPSLKIGGYSKKE